MEKLLIDYKFNSLQVENSGSGFQVVFDRSSVVIGPNKSMLGSLPKAVDLGQAGRAVVDLNQLNVNSKKFCLQVAFKINEHVSSRQNIIESTFLPFALYADKGATKNIFHLVGSTKLVKHGWSKVDTLYKKALRVNKWYTASLVYDFDTLGLFVDNQLISVHGFPNGLIKTNATKKLFFGTWVDGERNHFNGALAGFKWFDGIPSNLESLLDEQRASSEWHITYKHAQIKKNINTGKKEKGIKYDSLTGGHTQFYTHGGIMYHESVGVAFEIHGAIYRKYKSMQNKSVLGYLITDEVKAAVTSGRKSLFSKGAIYWSPLSKAIPVLDEIYLEYENLGESKALGFPIRTETSVPNGKEQVFQKSRMYFKKGSGRAQEVHGSILRKYINIGGVRKWGFPVSNESDVKDSKTVIGKYSEFENCTIYWKPRIGTFEVHGSIRKKYMETGGPLGKLGFPTSDEVDIPNHSGIGKINSFERGSILWWPGRTKVAWPFKIKLQRIHSREEEGAFAGQNDLFYYINILDGSRSVYKKRFPQRGSYSGHNIINPNEEFSVEIVPNNVNKKVSFSINIYDEDDTSSDDHLGRKTTILSAANGWGYKQNNLVFSQSFSKIKSLVWSIRPIDGNSFSEKEKWWGFDNFSTPILTTDQYATAFRDVDSEVEWWDITDKLQSFYYEWVVKKIASGGNCFGMSLEAIYARKNNSLLSEPLKLTNKDKIVINEINIKHAYQVGARPIWWFVGQFLTGNTHSPKSVFFETRNAFRRGDNPVVCLTSGYFGGDAHVVMPYEWDTRNKPWKMKVMDPNLPSDRVLTVDPRENTFTYDKYSGSAWSGGRFYYMPFCILDTPQRTPLWEAILLLLAGTILILGDDAETVSIKNANDKDLDGSGARAKKVLKDGNKPEEFFAPFSGFEGNIKSGQVMLRKEKLVSSNVNSEVVNLSTLPLNALVTSRRLRNFTAGMLPSNIDIKNAISNRSAHYITNDSLIMDILPDDIKNHLTSISNINSNRNFKHEVKGTKNGKLEYLIKSGLSEVSIESVIQEGEINTISSNNLNTIASNIEFKSARDKKLSIQIINKLGVNGDHVVMDISDISIRANKLLSLNIKQGLAGIEIENSGVSTNLKIRFTGKIDGKEIDKHFTMPFEGAIRIKPSTIVHTNELLVSDITKLFGTIKESHIITIN